jgi:hypothetical protein
LIELLKNALTVPIIAGIHDPSKLIPQRLNDSANAIFSFITVCVFITENKL